MADGEYDFVYNLVTGFDQIEEAPLPDSFINPTNIVSLHFSLILHE